MVLALLYIISPRARGTIYYKWEETPRATTPITDRPSHHRQARWQWEYCVLLRSTTGKVVVGVLRTPSPRGNGPAGPFPGQQAALACYACNCTR